MSIKQAIYLAGAVGIVLVELSAIGAAFAFGWPFLSLFLVGLSLVIDAMIVGFVGTEEGIL
jgi:hypothetical protein